MQLIVTLTIEAEAAFGGRAFAFLALQVVAAAAVGAAGGGADMAWMARWTVNDLPVPGRPLM